MQHLQYREIFGHLGCLEQMVEIDLGHLMSVKGPRFQGIETMNPWKDLSLLRIKRLPASVPKWHSWTEVYALSDLVESCDVPWSASRQQPKHGVKEADEAGKASCSAMSQNSIKQSQILVSASRNCESNAINEFTYLLVLHGHHRRLSNGKDVTPIHGRHVAKCCSLIAMSQVEPTEQNSLEFRKSQTKLSLANCHTSCDYKLAMTT